MSILVKASTHSMAHAPRSELLADLLSGLSQELLHAARVQTSEAAVDAAEQDSQHDTASILQKLLEAQREAAVLCSSDDSETTSAWNAGLACIAPPLIHAPWSPCRCRCDQIHRGAKTTFRMHMQACSGYKPTFVSGSRSWTRC